LFDQIGRFFAPTGSTLRSTRAGAVKDARVRRADLYSMLKELARLKRKREQLEVSLGLPHAA
jgi:hypothetical protein